MPIQKPTLFGFKLMALGLAVPKSVVKITYCNNIKGFGTTLGIGEIWNRGVIPFFKPKRLANRRDKKRETAFSCVSNISENVLASPVERGYEECPCPKKCTLHGECLLCVAYHSRKGALPRCERPPRNRGGRPYVSH